MFVENCLQYDDYTVLLRTGSNLEDINRFRSHTGKATPYLRLISQLS